MAATSAHGFDASSYPTTVTREVPGVGECRLDCLLMDAAMRLFAVERPFRLHYRRWSSDFIATTLAEPLLAVHEVENLPDLAREALRGAAAEANGCGEAYRALAGSHINHDERLFAAYYSTMREHFVSLATVGTEVAAHATAGIVRAAVPVVRPVVLASVEGVTRATHSLARAATRSLTRSLAHSRPALWVPPPRMPISSPVLEVSVGALTRRGLYDVGRLVAANRRQVRGGLMLYETLRSLSLRRTLRAAVGDPREAR